MKSTDENLFACEYWSEHQASLSLEQNKRYAAQDALRERNHRSELNKQLEKQRKNSEFWHRVMNVLTVIAIAVVIYTLFHFA